MESVQLKQKTVFAYRTQLEFPFAHTDPENGLRMTCEGTVILYSVVMADARSEKKFAKFGLNLYVISLAFTFCCYELLLS